MGCFERDTFQRALQDVRAVRDVRADPSDITAGELPAYARLPAEVAREIVLPDHPSPPTRPRSKPFSR
jgi:hypothetical protein